MPFGDNDLLALTVEPTLEPELPICDPHHHFWDFRIIRIPYQRYPLQAAVRRHQPRAQHPIHSVYRNQIHVPY